MVKELGEWCRQTFIAKDRPYVCPMNLKADDCASTVVLRMLIARTRSG